MCYGPPQRGPGSGGALVAVMESADLRNDDDPATGWGFDGPWVGTVVVKSRDPTGSAVDAVRKVLVGQVDGVCDRDRTFPRVMAGVAPKNRIRFWTVGWGMRMVKRSLLDGLAVPGPPRSSIEHP